MPATDAGDCAADLTAACTIVPLCPTAVRLAPASSAPAFVDVTAEVVSTNVWLLEPVATVTPARTGAARSCRPDSRRRRWAPGCARLPVQLVQILVERSTHIVDFHGLCFAGAGRADDWRSTGVLPGFTDIAMLHALGRGRAHPADDAPQPGVPAASYSGWLPTGLLVQ